ncbi:ATP-binding protein [Lachnoclostridium phytofermentans]|uniref:ATP-binding protein n=1 Tax=Lachnoclostridium phytofermentans TaxID=66219 RepID=UPI000495DD0E|nr:AAA family ATPase [Lachnoclostridium phytofermentans]
MIIKELHPGHFGKFHNVDVELTPGINVIYGKNEAGKSTLHAFVKGMLFGIEKLRGRAGKEDLYVKYQPWDTPGAYQGSMVLRVDGEDYRIIRSFYKKERSIKIIKESTGRELTDAELGVGAIIPKLTESIYRNTISIEQLRAKTEYELAEELKNYITNLSMSKSKEVDVNGAIQYLLEKKKRLEKQLPDEQIAELSSELKELQDTLKTIDVLSGELTELQKRATFLENKQKEYNRSTNQERMKKVAYYPAILEKFKRFMEMKQAAKDMEDKVEGLGEKTKKQASELDSSSTIEAHLKELGELRQKKQEFEEELKVKRQEIEPLLKQGSKSGRVIGAIIVMLGLAISSIPIPFMTIVMRCIIGIAFLVAGISKYIMTATKEEKNKQKLEDIKKECERQIFSLHSRRHDILLNHRVSNESQLMAKYNDVLKNEMEREQAILRKEEYHTAAKQYHEKADELEYEIIDYMKCFVGNPEATQECMQELWQEIEEFKEDIIGEMSANEEEHTSIRTQMERIRWTLEANTECEVKLEEKQMEYDESCELREALLEEIEAISLSIQTLKELSTDIHDSFGSTLNQMLSEIVSSISQGEYSSIVVDEKLNVSVLHRGQYVTLDRLSAGTMDQIFLALRLSVASLLFPEENMPILLDDSFALYDDERTKAALRLLAEETNRQVIIFTCHRREKELLEECKVPYHYVDLNDLGNSLEYA